MDISGKSSFIHNSALMSGGGGTFAMIATLYIIEISNFIGNSVKESGGGVYLQADVLLEIRSEGLAPS